MSANGLPATIGGVCAPPAARRIRPPGCMREDIVREMGTKRLSPDEQLAASVLRSVLPARVVGNEDGRPGRCDLRIEDDDRRVLGYVEVTRIVGQDYAKTTAILGGVEELRFNGELGRYWSVTVSDLKRPRWQEAKDSHLLGLLRRLEANGIERLPSIATLSSIENEIEVARAAGWDAIATFEAECMELGITQLTSSGTGADRSVTVRAQDAVRGGWPGAGAPKLVPWLSALIASVRLNGELKKLQTCGSDAQHLFLILDRHPELDPDLEMYVSDSEIAPPTEGLATPEQLSDVWLVHCAPTTATRWSSKDGWHR